MNKTAIKNFAVWARRKLIDDITYKAGLIGVSERGIAQPLSQSTKDLQFFDIGTKDYAQVAGSDIKQRDALVKAIQEKERTSDYTTAFNAIIEEVAYTWFNRLIAIRFMEVNDYLPSRVRVLSSENPAKNEPDFVTTPFDTDMEFSIEEQDKIIQLKDENKLDELFRMLFIKQCNKLHEILPELFEETNNYTELLLSIAFTDNDGIVYHLVHDIAEDDFNVEKEGQIEIIGWMYQYYNIELKDETYALLKKNVKITKDRIPAATQLFTPDWIVHYMVENSLGRYWLEGHSNDSLKIKWDYYLEEAEQEKQVQVQLEQIRTECRNLNPEDIKIIDPCMGSGHILVYCFDVLMQIYEIQGYTSRDSVQFILQNNLYGLDIDKRASQLAYFAIMMKARQYDRRFFSRGLKPQVFEIKESNNINFEQLEYFGIHLSSVEKKKAKYEIAMLIDLFKDAKVYGSLLNVENYDWNLLQRFIEDLDNYGQLSFDTVGIEKIQDVISILIKQGRIMSQKYEVVITNPPYMGSGSMGIELSKFVKDNYPDHKSDLFACFIDKCNRMIVKNGYSSVVTMQSWMFLSSFEKMREKTLVSRTITNLMHMENMVMGIAFGTAVTIFKNVFLNNYRGTYNHITLGDIENNCPKEFPIKNNRFSQISAVNFSRIPGMPIAYWASDQVYRIYQEGTCLGDLALPRQGLAAGKVDFFYRYWYEVNYLKIGFNFNNKEEFLASDYKYAPVNKGGGYRKWYGNNYEVIKFDKENYNLLLNSGNHLPSRDKYFLEGITWNKISSSYFSCRYSEEGFIFTDAGMKITSTDYNIKKIGAVLSSKVFTHLLGFLSETLNYETGNISRLPLLDKVEKEDNYLEYYEKCIQLSKQDWDSFEISWDFSQHPLVKKNVCTINEAYLLWEKECEDRIKQIKYNEESLNSIFIDIYELQNELTPDIEDCDITIRKANLIRETKSLISYAVGCMFGRYSLDEMGLSYAGGTWNERKYSIYVPNKDNCILITDEEYFENDIIKRFCEWVKIVYGAETLEENLDFIAEVLGNKGATSREVIRNYFLNDFIKDHIKIYQKRPIYWLFDSGKQNGFKALVYIHRWNADTVGNLRVEYLHRVQHMYEYEIIRMQDTIDNSRDSREVSKATKRKDKLQKQLKETKDYDAKLAHIALSRIELNLDDGVKVNYEKAQTDRDGKKMQILAKI